MSRLFHARAVSSYSAALGLGLLFCVYAAPATDPTGFPFTNETLNYTVNWPSGLSLGEAHISAMRTKSGEGPEQWNFDMTLDAGIPGFAVSDHYRSTATLELCALTLEKQYQHGSRKIRELTTFDQHAGVARRETTGGGKSDITVSDCAKDALTFLYYARRELGQGRVPPFQTVLFGAPYQVRLEYTGAQTVRVNDKKAEADRLVATLKGPASEVSFEMLFARDPARTPLVIRVPLSLGMFSMELAR